MAANQSVVTFDKPLQHISLNNWQARINELRNVSETQRQESFQLRQSARILRNETAVESTWQTYYNNERLSDRVCELNRWNETMTITLQRISKEINQLMSEKAETEKCLESMITPLLVVSECITQRDARLAPELTHDDVDIELNQELCIVEENKRMLRDQCKAAWNKYNELQEVKFKLELDIGDKREAQDIDINQLNLNKQSSVITYKVDPQRVSRNACTYNGWLQYCKELKELAERELKESYSVRESLFVSRERAKNLLYAQQEKTELTIRKRIFETQRGRNELAWQKIQMEDELKRCMSEIDQVQSSLNDNKDTLKLAETKLENRTYRSGMELVLDDVYDGLSDEITKLREIRNMLNEKFNKAKATYNILDAHMNKTTKDLARKEHTLTTDIRGLDLRMRLREQEYQPCRNLELSNLDDQIVKK